MQLNMQGGSMSKRRQLICDKGRKYEINAEKNVHLPAE